MEIIEAPVQSLRQQNIEETLREMVVSASLEMTPRQIAGAESLSALLPPATRIYVPFLPNAAHEATVTACRSLLAAGMEPVPHLPARAVESTAELDGWLAELAEMGVRSLMLIAGDVSPPRGPYADTAALLASGRIEAHGFRQLGITGHPEGHPSASEDALERALAAKLEYAAVTGAELWVVTQFVLSSPSAIRWCEQMRAFGCRLPIFMGIPGPARLATLIAYAAQCGVGTAARMLRRRPSAARLLGSWTPGGLAHELAEYRLDVPDSPLGSIHLFPFGGFEASAAWLAELRGVATDEVEIRTGANHRR